MTEKRYSRVTDLLVLVVIASAILTPKLGHQWIGVTVAGLAGLGACVVYLRFGASAKDDHRKR